MPVQRETSFATSSSIISSFRNFPFFWILTKSFSALATSCKRLGILLYLISATLRKSAWLWLISAWKLSSSISFLKFLIFWIKSFSVFHLNSKTPVFSFKSAKDLAIAFSRFWQSAGFSGLRASFSISNFWISLFKLSSSAGSDSISNLRADIDSSIKSTALSGKNLSVIYLAANCEQATKAESFIFTPWWSSYLSFSPRKIKMVSSIEGSAT